ncbi:bifunctional oligoribonuclease/PAP phosphatase NrnA [bacterium]|nr:bifunctional oligoribonuclease/PAP phosphatase NrnA [bacterium]
MISCIRERNDFLVTTHIRPDGDSIASVLIIAYILRTFKKRFSLVLDDCIPNKLDFLEGIDEINRYNDDGQSKPVETVLILDSSDLDRIGRVRNLINEDHFILNIDHHPGNTNFGQMNLVDDRLSSTVELVYPLVENAEIAWTPALATCVYTGILSDTGRFLFANTSANTFFVCAEMVRYGADPSSIAELLYNRNSPDTMKAYAKALSSLEFHCNNQVTCIHLTHAFMKTGGIVDTEGFVDTITGIEGVKASFICVECNPGEFRISLRSKGDVDVNKVAGYFNGGGHVRASGCTVTGNLSHVKNRIIEKLEQALSGA